MGITLVVVPWELAKTTGGEALTVAATWSTIILLFLAPISGRLIDRISRRFTLRLCTLVMGIVLQITSLVYSDPAFRVAFLCGVFFFSHVFFLFFHNALAALIQEISDRKGRGKLNGWMQIEIQISTFFVGFLIIYLVGSEEARLILFVNGILLSLSSYLLGFIPYKKKKVPRRASNSRAVFIVILKRYDLLILGVCGNIAFICSMMLNIVIPIYFASVLQIDISAVAKLSIAFGIGASSSGFFFSRVTLKRSAVPVMNICLALYAAIILSMSLVPNFLVILTLFGGLGAVSSAIRVVFSTYLMSVVDEDIFGSYLSVISAITYALRAIFSFILMLIIAWLPIASCFWLILFISLVGVALIQVHKFVASGHKLKVSDLDCNKEIHASL